MSPAITVCGWCKLTSDLDLTPVRVILIGLQVCKWVKIYIFRLFYKLTSDDLWPWFVTFWPHEHMKVPILYKQTKFGSNQTSTFQMRAFSHFQPILQLDLRWPLTLICDLWHINIWGFPCCIYDPTLVEIHQSMWKIQPNVNLFSQQQTTAAHKVIPMCLSC